MNKINVVLSKILDDPNFAQSFRKFDELEDIKNFIKKFDSGITDDELSEFLDDDFSEIPCVVDDGLHKVSGGICNKKLLAWPMALLSSMSVAVQPGFAMKPGRTHDSMAAFASGGKRKSLGERILSWIKAASDGEVAESYLFNGFLGIPSKTSLSNSMESRRQVFLNTIGYCIRNKDRLSVNFDDEDFISSASEVVNYNHPLFMRKSSSDKLKATPVKIWLTNGKSLQSLNAVNARLNIAPKDVKNTAVLNFANYYCPGGGVVQGCTAQEECLCRITSLYPHLATKSMKRDFYGRHTIKPKNILDWYSSGIANEAIYTKDIKQIKEDYNIGRVGEYVDGCKFNVITAAAPDFRMHELDAREIPQYKELMKDLWRMILATAYEHGDKNLVLGALGCGAFKNDPKLVSEAFYDVLSEKGPGGMKWSFCFDNIILPIFTSNKNDQRNYDAFRKTFDERCDSLYNFSEKSAHLAKSMQTEIDLPSYD